MRYGDISIRLSKKVSLCAHTNDEKEAVGSSEEESYTNRGKQQSKCPSGGYTCWLASLQSLCKVPQEEREQEINSQRELDQGWSCKAWKGIWTLFYEQSEGWRLSRCMISLHSTSSIFTACMRMAVEEAAGNQLGAPY